MGTLKLTGKLICATESEAAVVRSYLPEHVRLTRAEPGCLTFNVLASADPLVWLVEELFEDESAFAAHQARVAQSEWGRASAGITREYQITR